MLRTLYNPGGEPKELAKETITLSAIDNRYTFYFSNPSYDLVLGHHRTAGRAGSGDCGRANYYATVEVTGAAGAVEGDHKRQGIRNVAG